MDGTRAFLMYCATVTRTGRSKYAKGGGARCSVPDGCGLVPSRQGERGTEHIFNVAPQRGSKRDAHGNIDQAGQDRLGRNHWLSTAKEVE